MMILFYQVCSIKIMKIIMMIHKIIFLLMIMLNFMKLCVSIQNLSLFQLCCQKVHRTLLFTNIDLIPNDRINYSFDNAFNTNKLNEKSTQTQNEIKVEKVKGILLSGDFMYFSLDDSTFKKSVIFKDGRVDFLKKINSPFVFNTNSLFKMDNKSYLYILQPFDDCNGFSISQMFLPETKHWLRSDDSLFIKYSYLQNLSNIVDNCSEFILNRNKFNVLSAIFNFSIEILLKNSKMKN